MEGKNILSSKLFIILLTLLAISLSIFIFGMIYQNELPKLVEEINNSTIGGILTAIITVLLLQGQTATEEMKEQNMKVFEKKSEIFNDFMNNLWGIWKKKSISMDEIVEIIGRVSKDIIPYTKPNTTKEILGYLNVIADSIDKEDMPKKIDENVFNIINVLAKEIGLGGELNAEVRQQIASLESKVMPFFNRQKNIQKLSDLVRKHNISSEVSDKLTFLAQKEFVDEEGILWWRIGTEEVGMWLRFGDTGNSGTTYITFWSDFSHREYTDYRYAQRGHSKDWFVGYETLKFDYNDLRNGKDISEKTLQELSISIIEFYHKAKIKGKTIQEIINETKNQ